MIDNRYVQLEYLESSGTQYIDTGWQPTSKVLAVEFKVNCLSSMATASVCGSENTGFNGARWLFTLYGQRDDWRQYPLIGTWNNGQGSGYHISTPQNTDVIARIDYNNGTTTCTSSQGDNWTHTQSGDNITNHKQNLNLFMNASTQKSSIKLYSYKIWDNDVLVRDLVPAKRKSDSVLGMFDKVNSVFYTNAGTGSFIGGKEIKNTFRSRKIPFAYNEVSYLESSGKEYIDTGINTPSSSTTVVRWEGLAGVKAGSYGRRFVAAYDNSGVTHYSEFNANRKWGAFDGYTTPTIEEDKMYNCYMQINGSSSTDFGIEVDGVVSTSSATSYQSTSFGNFVLFRLTSSYAGSGQRIGVNKLIINDVLVRNFIPVVRKIDNVAGMYDTVEGKFYGNASGQGAFKTGDEILTVDKVRIGKGISGYEFYDYIENTAGQRIDTGILPKANQDYEVRFKLNSVGSNYAVFGGRDTQTNKTATLFFLTSGKSFRFDRTSQINVSSGVVPNAGDVFKFECANNVATLTNETTGQSATTTMTGSYNLDGNYPIHLFSVNTAGTDSLGLNGSIYEWKLKENGELVQHLVPAKRLSDNSIGMLDLVKREFHNNIGSGVFTTGSIVPAPAEQKEVQELRLPYNGNKYKFFDYIQSSGTQYIDLGKPFNSDTIEFIYSDATSATSGAYMFGTYPSATRYLISCNPSNEHVFAYKGTQVFRATKGQDKCTLYVNPTTGDVKFNDTNYTITAGTIQSSTNIFLFSASNTGNVPYEISRLARLRVYSFKTWSPDGVLTRHIIPAQRLSDNAIGMYDKVSGVFFGNKGTGVFIAGNEIVSIPKEYERLEYLESSGTEYIDTGIKAIANSKVEMRFNRTAYAGQASVSAIFGGYDSNQRNYGLAIDTTTIYWMFGGQSNAKKTFPLNTDYDVVFDAANKTFTVGDYTQSFSSLSLPAQSNGNIYLFTNSAVGSLATYNKQYWLKGKIYYFKYCENGTLVRNLFPVRRKADNVLGMLDTVNNVFYTNRGTGSFTTSTKSMPNKVMMPFWKRYPDVPNQYEVKEYLESDGYAQIDSGIRFTQGDKIDMVGRFIDPKHDDGLICMTPWNQGNNSRFMFACAIQGGTPSFCMSYNNLAGGSNKVNPNITPDTEYHRWTYDNLTLTIDDGVSSLTNTEVYPADSKITGTVYLFRRFNGGCKVAIKYYKHWRNGQLIASYVPVRRKSDNVLGMYDRVTDTFFTNKGSGSFSSN